MGSCVENIQSFTSAGGGKPASLIQGNHSLVTHILFVSLQKRADELMDALGVQRGASSEQ